MDASNPTSLPEDSVHKSEDNWSEERTIAVSRSNSSLSRTDDFRVFDCLTSLTNTSSNRLNQTLGQFQAAKISSPTSDFIDTATTHARRDVTYYVFRKRQLTQEQSKLLSELKIEKVREQDRKRREREKIEASATATPA